MTESNANKLFAVGVFFFAMFLGYRIAPNNWYHDEVQDCLDFGVLSDQECFMNVAEKAYILYTHQE